jgi:hypothetical protein
MKQLILLSVIAVLTMQLSAQVPQKMNYQAVVRNSSGQPLAGGTSVSVRFQIHDGSAAGPVVFQENQIAITNQFGLVYLVIGNNGNMGAIDWSTGAKYLQVEIDQAGGSNYTDMGTSQLLSVPYALFAGNSSSGPRGATGPTGANGNTGATGQQGSMGVNGATGATGPTGATGNPGQAGQDGKDGVTGATGNPGQAGQDGKDGKDGVTGATGPTGATGDPGQSGQDGKDGKDGVTGATGPTGATGNPGQAGQDGKDGKDGVTGATGPTGATGDPGQSGQDGKDGKDGVTGATGPTGATGDPGQAGQDGKDGKDGVTGATGPTGATGNPGQAGQDGKDGKDGVTGATGPTGATGNPGQAGQDGKDGKDGVTGATGPTGYTGPTGATGNNGTAGQNGISVFGTSQLSITSSTSGFTLIPGLSTSVTVPSNSFVYITTDGGFYTNSTSTTGYSSVDFAIVIDGNLLSNGGYARITADNPNGTSTVSVHGTRWAMSLIQQLSAGTHTVEVYAVYNAGSSCVVSGDNTQVNQGELSVVILKQ